MSEGTVEGGGNFRKGKVAANGQEKTALEGAVNK